MFKTSTSVMNRTAIRYMDLNQTQINLLQQKIDQLTESEARFRLMADSVPVLIWETDSVGLCNYFNKQWLDFTGRTLALESGNGWMDGVHPDDINVCTQTYLEAFQSQRTYSTEYRLRRFDGEYCWMLDNGIPRFDSNGQFAGYIGSCVNINESKIAAEALRESESKYRHIAENTTDGIVIFDADNLVQYVSPGYLNQLGYSMQEVISQGLESIHELIHTDEQNYIIPNIIEAIKLKVTSLTYSFRVKHKSGNYIWREDNASFNYDEQGNYTGATIICRDISEWKLAELKRQETLEQIRYISNQIPGVIYQYRLDADGSVSFPYVSESVKNTMGVSAEEIYRHPEKVFSAVHPDDYVELMESIEQSSKVMGVWQKEFRIKLAEDHILTVLGSSTPQQAKDGAVIWHGFITDITELKKSQEKIKQLSLAVEQSPVSVVITDTTGAIEYVNQKFVDITGYTFEEALGKNPRILKSGYTPPEEYQQLWDSLAANGNWKGIFHNKKKNGELYWESASISPILNDKGNITHILAIKEDITERKQAEEMLKKYAADLKRSNTELENFAYIASHDLQEPLRMINSFLNLLEKRLNGKLDEQSKDYIHYAIDGANRLKLLIQDLLQYSRVGNNKDEFTLTKLNGLAQYIHLVLKDTIDSNKATITVKPMPLVNVNKTLINTLFVNLVENALKYRSGQPPVIEIGFSEDEHSNTFYVKDNGIGISPEYFEKIFVIFKRLHGKGEYMGTGIGLALCKKITDIHKGEIWVKSTLGQGSTFYFSIPK